jgi:hypothetical protein
MAKKNFKAATEDIFGEYKEPTATATLNKEKQPKIYELFLLSIEKSHLTKLKAEAAKTKTEIKDVLDEILTKHFNS